MKSRLWIMAVGVCLALGGATPGKAATYYVDDDANTGDIYTAPTITGNDINDGLTTNTPKRTLGSVLTNAMAPGDVIYIDTGTYAPVTIPATVIGAAGNRILFQGSTNFAAGGTVFAGSGNLVDVRGRYLHFRNFRANSGTVGLSLNGAAYCLFEQITAVYNGNFGTRLDGTSNSNAFRQCVFGAVSFSAFSTISGARGNQIEQCVAFSSNSIAFSLANLVVTNLTGSIAIGRYGIGIDAGSTDIGTRNIFFPSLLIASGVETISDLTRAAPGWTHNIYADPKFFDSAALDFHLLSPAGFVSNGVWVTNAALPYSPAIDFGARTAAIGDEPAPNGSRVNTGPFGGTTEASKSRTDDWLFAISYGDGGALIQTGRLEWTGVNLGPGATVDLQYSTNNGAAWSNIETGVDATLETYAWTPAFSYPSVLWRVVSSTNSAVASTNAKAFSVRMATNTAFNFYVNDGSTAGDEFGTGLGDNANDGAAAIRPKRSLQAILDAYSIRGGDTIYVDTGNYGTNFTTTITRFDSGTANSPVRIIGSTKGAVFGRGSTTADTLMLDVASHLEIENLRLTDGRYGLNGSGSSNVVFRNVCFTGNQYGLNVVGVRHVFEGCLIANNALQGYVGSGSGPNYWKNGVIWSNPTAIAVLSNAAVTVSNSILGNGAALFGVGSQSVSGDYNMIWNIGVGLGYSSFSAFQNAGNWTRSLYADPLFANAGAGDYHLKSLLGRYDTNLLTFATNDLVHSPAIDFGDPAASVSNEPPPNGTRLNAGMFGGTTQASKSRTNAWLQALSYADGGTLDAQAGSWLRWTGSAFEATNLVTLWLSRDSGGSWEMLVTNVTATNGAYFFSTSSTNDPSSTNALWRITLDGADPAVSSQTAVDFTYKSGPYIFYVNDSSTNGDIYCTAPGNNANLGLSAGAPKADLHAVIANNQLGPGDRVYVDTGSYSATGTVVMTSGDSGASTNPVVIIGSTNRLAGGSVMGRPGSFPANLGFVFQPNSSNIVLQDIVLTNVLRGVAMTNALNIVLDGMEVRGAIQRAFDLQGNTRNVELRRCVAYGGAIGVYLNQATNVSIRYGLFWQNSANAVYVDSQVGGLLENSILASTQINAALYSISTTNNFLSDYNNIHAGAFTRVGVNRAAGGVADNLAAWQALTGWDIHGVPGDPQLADPAQYDYHLKTEQTQGRRLPNGQQTSDPLSSPLLDAGNPASDVSAEPAPNGGRVNIGRFGGTWAASIAPATPWLKTVSFGDAGKVQDGATTLRWLAGSAFSNQTVKVDVSVDGGNTWATNVASGIPATTGMVTWTVGGLPDTPAGIWRVVCLENTNWFAQSTNFFAIRNGALDLFVATADTNEAVYTTGPGLANNWRATSNAPLNSVAAVFDRFDLEPGDRIWVDNGTFAESNAILIGMKDSATTNNPIQIVGNRAKPYAGTVLKRTSAAAGAYGIQLAYANGIQIDSLMISNAYIGVHAENSQGLRMDRVRVGYCVTNAVYAGANSEVTLTGAILEQSLAAGLQTHTGSVVRVSNSLIRDNLKACLFFRGGNVQIKNSILEAAGTQGYVYYLGSAASFSSDYNNIRVSEGANVAGGDSRQPSRFMIEWQEITLRSNDVRSSGYDALFANAAGLDFHLQSQYGRYDPITGLFVSNDVATSKLIDLGDPASDYVNEPVTNGDRINVGLYGNTVEASKSSGLGSLVPLTMSDGGTIRGDVHLYWAYNEIAGNERVYVDYSWNGGITWTNIGTNIYADVGSSSEGLLWRTTNFPSGAQGVWRICTTNGTVCGQTETYFAVKNDPASYYINDGSTNGDVYCTAKGLSSNNGLSSNTPLTSLETLMNRYKVEHGDTIYVDTGLYPRSTPLVISIPSVAPTNYLIIRGSTNEAAGGTVFTNAGGSVLGLQNVDKVELRDLRLHGGSQGLQLSQSDDNRLVRVRAVGTRGTAFSLGTQCDQNQFIQCAALHFSSTGFFVASPVTVDMPPTTNFWVRGVISSIAATSNGIAVSTGALMDVRSGRIYASNSVFVAAGPAHVMFSAPAGIIHGDYNVYHRPFTNSLFARGVNSAVFGVIESLVGDIAAWAEWNSSDNHSFAADPLFGDLAGGDLHPKSAGGRYLPADGTFLPDAETSPLIDAAATTDAWGLESEPNGSRANLGIYGNDPQASRTPTNGTFVLLTLNQGGMVRGGTTLKWIARGGATNGGHLVNIQISTNSGETFDTIGSSAATAGQYLWNSSNSPSLPTMRWKVQSQSQSSWASASERDFAVHNTNMTFYVNDASTNNDVYCSAPGAFGNTGLESSSPVLTLTAVLSQYDLEPGDTVRIDTGNYIQSIPTSIGYLDGGTAAEPVTIQGSTNRFGSVFIGAGVEIANVRGVRLRNLSFNSQTLIADVASVLSSEDVTFEQVDIQGGPRDGFDISLSSNVFLRNFSVSKAAQYGVSSEGSFNTRLEFGALWSNGTAQVLTRNQSIQGILAAREASFVAVSNCVLGAFGVGNPIYELRGTIRANHNNLFRGTGGLAALSYMTSFRREIESVGSWTSSEFGQDNASLSHNPQFADAAAGDFHPKSSMGRFDPAVGTHVAVDSPADNSPLIDAGNPLLLCAEPEPNGARVNIGRFGNTAQASMTPTNGALTLISFNDGGQASGTNVLINWLARGSASNALLTISYSADGGSNWTVLVSGIAASTGYWMWDSTLSEQSVQARLKLEGTDGSSAMSERNFSVRNGVFKFYINDASTNNDVYCTAVGNNANSGLTNSRPMADLNALLAKYDLESGTNGGDIVYIDTGVYKGVDPWRIAQVDSAGSLEKPPVIIQGSTNSSVNGTVLDRTFNSVGIQMDYAVGILLRNITVSNTVGSAVVFNDCYGAAAESVSIGAANDGFVLYEGSGMRIANSMVWSANRALVVDVSVTSTNTVYPVIENNLFWENAETAIQLSGRATVRNNILSVAPNKYVYQLGQLDILTSDHNAIWLPAGGRVFRREVLPVPDIYETVGAWSSASGQDLHSFDSDPLLANPALKDFHLKSQVGRRVPGTGVWTNDAVSSPLIDAGWTGSSAWTNEPDPNGRRVNIGPYGGTWEASKSGTNSAVYLLTLNRGGVASGQVALNWQAAGQATGHTVRLFVSIDNGAAWTLISEGVKASLGGLIWNSTALPSSPLALWRVQDEQETNVVATSERNFVLHNGPIYYYVNDEFPDGDIYCGGALGSSTNSGVASGSPKRWVSEIVDTYDLEPGDIIYVDTGRYQTSEPTVIGDVDAGGASQIASQQLTIQGSTNELEGGSLYLIADPAQNAFNVINSHGIRFRNLSIQGASNGLSIDESYYIAGDWLDIRGAEDGVWAHSSSNVAFSHSAFSGNRGAGIRFSGDNKAALHVDSCVLWSNRYGIYLHQGYARATNSIFGIVAPDSFGYYMALGSPDTSFECDYNNLYASLSGAYVGGFQSGSGPAARTNLFPTVSAWVLATGQDGHSLEQNPLLANPGFGDYHLKSAGGRYQVGLGWTNDTVSSPLIDSGNSQSTAWTAEPDPNGRRLNIGLHGGTAWASKTPPNGNIIIIFPNTGARVSGVVTMQWMAVSAATNHTVLIEYSPDDGVAIWTNIVNGALASGGTYLWPSESYGRSARARWRITCREDESITATSGRFILDNGGTIPYFVNDNSTNNDVYCTAPGSDENDGLSPESPKANVQAVLDAYGLAKEDVVYVDAGTYVAGAPPIVLNPTTSGYIAPDPASNLYVTIQGSTNPAAPTTFVAPSFSTPHVFSLQYAENVRMKDLTIRNASVGVQSYQTIGCEFENVHIENNQSVGLNMSKSEGLRLIRSVLWKNSSTTGGVAVLMNESSLVVENSVLWGSPIAVSVNSSSLSVTNSVLDAEGTDGRIYLFSTSASALGGFRGDYNNYQRKNGALICEQRTQVGGSDYYDDMPRWSAVNGSDRHSLTATMSLGPEFADEIAGDFHPKSTRGRFAGVVKTNDVWVDVWTNDAVLSPLVDAGAPAWSAENELEPNGGIVNIGAYGNTRQASMTQTNPPWLRAVSYNCEGLLSGNVLLYWLHGGLADDAPVKLEYSTDYEVTWDVIASNLPAGSREYTWNTDALPLTLAVNWRVVSEANTNIWDVSDCSLPHKPGPVDYFVNDAFTNCDVWCTGPGLPYDFGADPTNRRYPIDSLAKLLEKYPVAGGDRVFVDTGVYPVTDATRILMDGRNMGTPEDGPLKIYGSTNFQCGGALLAGNGTANGIEIQNTRDIEIYGLRVSNAMNGVALMNVSGVLLEGMELFQNATNGILSVGSGDLDFRRVRLWKNRNFGFESIGSKGWENFENSTIWGNRAGAAKADNNASFLNSILCVTNAAPIYTENGSAANITGDYNMYGLGSSNVIATNAGEKVTYSHLRDWQDKNKDWHSVVLDPLFVDPHAGNFHLQSRAGYWSNGTLQVSINTSWAIDAGDPSADWTPEPTNNGGRINMGAYGGTAEASLSDTNSPEFLPITLRDGGVAPDGQSLYWLFRGLDPATEIRIEYSADKGSNWTVVAGGLSAGSSPYAWYSSDEPSPECLWRIVLPSSTNIWGATEVYFTHLTRPLTYYVNDSSTNNDVYCTAPGRPDCSGYSSNCPLDSIQAVLAKFQLHGGDGIKVDTGDYVLNTTVLLDVLNSGTETSRVYIVGSTNLAAGGSRFLPGPELQKAAFSIYKAHDINLSFFQLSGFTNGFSLEEETRSCTISDMDIQGSVGPAVNLVKSTSILLQRVLIREGESVGVAANISKAAMDGCVIWSNQSSALYMGDGAEMGITNSVLQAFGNGRYCYSSPSNAIIRADYNNLFIQNGAQIASINGLQYEELPQWVRGKSQDRHSLSTDPLFHDPANGDFHPRSVAGRYHAVHGWTNDVPEGARGRRDADPCEGLYPELNPESTDYSPLIDMGSPRTAWSNEPSPNGGRRNIGLYGNTWQDSKSNTNEWLRAVTAMSGGILYGGVNLVWGFGSAVATNAMARFEYSFNNGLDWVRIGESSVGAGEYYWQSDLRQAGIELWLTSPGARWRIYLLENTNVMDMTDTYFGLRNSPFRYYLNDTSRVNDVYTDAIGNDCNMGFYPGAPKLTLGALLEDVDLEPTDLVYVDTGVYLMNEPNPPWLTDTNMPIRWEASDGGGEGERVLVNGSTHPDGSVFLATNRFAVNGFFFLDADFVELKNLQFSGESISFSGNGLVVSNLVVTNGFNPTVSFQIRSDSSVFEDLRVDRAGVTLSGNSNRVERMHQRWGETTIVGTNVTMLRSSIFTTSHLRTGVVVNASGAVISNCTVVSTNGSALSKHGFGSLRLGHNILVAGGSETNSVIEWHDGPLISDWNNLFARGSAWVGQRNGKWERLAYWQAASGQDANSVAFEPLFQNEAAGDLHLNSKAGRWSPVFNDWDVDAVHSPLIDLGDPWVGTALEPMPNGYRRNLGAYGGTTQASLSLETLWLTALTQNDGGVLKGTNVVLRWAAGNAGGRTVTLQYFDGSSWQTIATGISATSGYYVWNTTGFPDSFNARWRVVEEGAEGEPVSDQTDVPFALRNQAHGFYVNDDDQTGDIYCSTNGSASNDGLTPATPKLTLQAILDTYDLEGGDTVYLDTGGYASAADIRIIWSRSGSTNADVIIQGNTNGAHTVLTRSGATGFPAVGIDVKASRIQLANMAIQGVNRAVLLESNLNATVRGVVVKNAETGVAVDRAMGTVVENSAFWNTGWGVSLVNTRTSILQNLTFVASTLAGIHLSGTLIDTLQNNIFIPAADAYAYSIGTTTSLLTSATMDYNLYDFSAAGAGFYAGAAAAKDLRRWQVGKIGEYAGMYKDFRSAITNADLVEIAFEPLDFHPKSVYGRWTESGWTLDTNTSWAVDHGNPNGDYSREPTNNGERINIGMYGNTEQASMGSTNVEFEVRTLLDPTQIIRSSDSIWPMIWSAHLLDESERGLVQFSGNGGSTWLTLTNVGAYAEYFIWQANANFQTVQGRWRIIGETSTNVWAITPYGDDGGFDVRLNPLEIISQRTVNGLQRFDWQGGVQGLHYQIAYSDDFGLTWRTWEPKYNGPAWINRTDFYIPTGESQLIYNFEDRTSYQRRTRWYTIWEFQ